jgi:polyketide biosynthesis enoyl-CoA hydratase PksI
MTGPSHIPRLVRAADGIASLQIATDAEPHVGLETISALQAAADEIRSDPSVRALVIEGGVSHFCSGATRETLLSPDAAEVIARLVSGLPRALLSMPVPTLAAMGGHAIGGGFMLGLWCDLALLGEESLYGANFLQLGFTPGMGASVLLDELLGVPLATDLLLTGRIVKGRDLKAAGVPLSHAVMPRSEVRLRTFAKAQEVASTSRSAALLFKHHLAARKTALFEQALASELAMHRTIFADPETRARIAESYPR